MNIKEFEELVLKELKKVVDCIITENLELPISAKSRVGAEISDWLEEKFVEYTMNNVFFKGSEGAARDSTKNPWDARTDFVLNNTKEEIWIDFKAFKITSANSNPDIGTPNKIIKLINEGKFYHAFIHVFYETTDIGLKFVKLNNSYSKLYFLKDISPTFRRNPKNQLQVNISAASEYRTREDFIKLLMDKIKESHQRQIEISNKALKKIDKITEDLLKANKKSEDDLTKKIQ
ncbi:MAG: hypothetical protein M0Q45_05695 [Bacteroidales bacterium]|nr:hypothetical protein [Bacteroidales bacterium]MCK9498982.1 hypothetical protein [Bacteroidales bacterium]